jgi:hypothetical protein
MINELGRLIQQFDDAESRSYIEITESYERLNIHKNILLHYHYLLSLQEMNKRDATFELANNEAQKLFKQHQFVLSELKPRNHIFSEEKKSRITLFKNFTDEKSDLKKWEDDGWHAINNDFSLA